MFTIIPRRCLMATALRHLPRVKTSRDWPGELSEEAVVDLTPPEPEPDIYGRMIFDNERKRTADPTVPATTKKASKRTADDVIKATRKMRAAYLQKEAAALINNNNQKKVEHIVHNDKSNNDSDSDDFFGLPKVEDTFLASAVESPGASVKSRKENRSEGLHSSQYMDTFDNSDGSSDTSVANDYQLEDRTVKPVNRHQSSSLKNAARVNNATKPTGLTDGDGVVDNNVVEVIGGTKLKEETYAFDVAMQIRRSLEGRNSVAQDSKGFRTMIGSVPDWEAMTRTELFNTIRKSIVYNADGIVAINKCYGLSCQGGPGTRVYSVASCFEPLAEWLEKLRRHHHRTIKQDSSNTDIGSIKTATAVAVDNEGNNDEDQIWCRLVHRLDRDTTGVLLIATNQTVAAKLRYWFNERKVSKVYWAITKFVPKESEGIIDIPMYECQLSKGVYRMNLVPVTEASQKMGAVKAVTRYKVLDANTSSAALIECYPETGVKHQLRCHLGLGLATPILGDHKYTHADSIKPQRLPPSVLTALDMRQAKVRSVPLHLHAARLVLPEFVDGRTIAISARPPQFFIDTARRLKLTIPNL